MLEDVGEISDQAIPIPNVSFKLAIYGSTFDFSWNLAPPKKIVLEVFRSEQTNMRISDVIQVNEAVLRKVVEWCEHHKSDPTPVADDDNDSRKKSTDIEEWDQKFMQVDQEMLFEIILVWDSRLH